MSLWLVGMMGSGKSTVGPELAARLGVAFVDTDFELAMASGMTISRMWEVQGELEFRNKEREMVAGIAGSRAVVATGGGVPLDASNRDLMRATGKVVWLDASAHAIEARLAGSADRPVLTDLGDDGVAGLLERRRPFYESIADLSVDTTQRDIDEIVDRIAAWALAAGFPDD